MSAIFINGYDDPSGHPVGGPALTHSGGSLLSALGHNRRGNHLKRQGDPQWHQDQVIEVAQDGDGVGNQVDGLKA